MSAKIFSQAYTDCVMRPFPSLMGCVAIILVGAPIKHLGHHFGEIITKQVWSKS